MHAVLHTLKTLFILANISAAISLIQLLEFLAVLLVFLTVWFMVDWVKNLALGKSAKPAPAPPPADKALDVDALMSQGMSLWKRVESNVAQPKN